MHVSTTSSQSLPSPMRIAKVQTRTRDTGSAPLLTHHSCIFRLPKGRLYAILAHQVPHRHPACAAPAPAAPVLLRSIQHERNHRNECQRREAHCDGAPSARGRRLHSATSRGRRGVVRGPVPHAWCACRSRVGACPRLAPLTWPRLPRLQTTWGPKSMAPARLWERPTTPTAVRALRSTPRCPMPAAPDSHVRALTCRL